MKPFMRHFFPAAFLFISNAALAHSVPVPEDYIAEPWFTGPLLAPSGVTVPKGHTNIEPYLFYTDSYGVYGNNWQVVRTSSSQSLSPAFIISRGLTDRIDVQASIPYAFNFNQSQSYDAFGDVSLQMGFQAISSDVWPNLRISLGETFPSGQYNNLHPNYAGVNATGAGSYQTSLAANFQKTFRVLYGRVLRSRLSIAYTIPTSVHVIGFNTFGGGFGTNGTVLPGQKFGLDLGLEYTVTQHWVPALDIAYSHAGASSFKGTPGVTTTGAIASNTSNVYDLISLAPAIEYNFNANLGVIGGAWFSATGKNAGEFASAVVAVNYYI